MRTPLPGPDHGTPAARRRSWCLALSALLLAFGAANVARASPPNDDFASAIVLDGTEVRTTGSNVDATVETDEPVHGGNDGGRSVWWSWTAPASGQVLVDTLVSRFDTLLGVYTGDTLETLTGVAGNDDAGTRLSRVEFDAVAGTTYRIAVDGYEGASGDIGLRITSGVIRVPEDHGTIQEAIDLAAPGDTILVAPGLYLEQLDVPGRNLVIASTHGPEVTIVQHPDLQSPLPLVQFQSVASGVLSGFTFSGHDSESFRPGINIPSGNEVAIAGNIVTRTENWAVGADDVSALIIDNLITGNGGSAVNAQSGVVGSARVVEVTDNEMSLNEVSSANPEVITLTPLVNAIVENNWIHGNAGPAIGARQLGWPTDALGELTISHNVISGTTAGAEIVADRDLASLLNNTVVSAAGRALEAGNAPGPFIGNVLASLDGPHALACAPSGSTTFVDSRDNVLSSVASPLHASCDPVTEQELGTFDDPLFVDPADDDFALDGASPGIDAVAPVYASMRHADFHGNPRVADGDGDGVAAADAGAIENNAGGTIGFSSRIFSGAEADGQILITVHRQGGAAGAVSAILDTAPGNATPGADFTPVSGQVITFPDGDSTPRTIPIPVFEDGVDENEESFRLHLSNPSGGALLGRQRKATAVIDAQRAELALQANADDGNLHTLQTASITLRTTNVGTADSTNVVLAFTLPSSAVITQTVGAPSGCGVTTGEVTTVSCELGDVPVDGERAVTVSFRSFTRVSNFLVAAEVSGGSAEADLQNNRASVPVSFTPAADLAVAVVSAPDGVDQFDPASIVFEVSNAGDTTPLGNSVNVGLPATVGSVTLEVDGGSCGGTVCSFAPLAPGETRQIRVAFIARQGGALSITATASLSQAEVDPVSANNQATAAVNVSNAIRLYDFTPIEPVTEFDTYLIDGKDIEVESYSGEVVDINGVPTIRVSFADGDTGYATFDDQGLLIHRVEGRDPDLGIIRVSLTPPLSVLPALIEIGRSYDSSGTATLSASRIGSFTVNYTSRATVVGFEEVTVPRGTFDALRVNWTFRLFGHVRGQFIETLMTDTSWYAEGIGEVKSIINSDGDVTVSELIGNTPTLLAPAPGSELAQHHTEFAWNLNNTPASHVRLLVGRSPGRSDYFDSGNLSPDVTSQQVSALPMTGETVHARLRFRIERRWYHKDFTFTTADLPLPELTAPSASDLDASSVLFQWSDNGHAVTHWRLQAGSRRGRNDFFDSGNLGADVPERMVTGLPAYGETVHVRLRWRIGGRWSVRDHEFTAADFPAPALIAPAGPTLAGASETFRWTANGHAVTHWRLLVGSRPGRGNHFDSRYLDDALTQVEVPALPAFGETVHVRLMWRIGRRWTTRDHEFTAADFPAPALIAPAGPALDATSAAFQWTANGHAVTHWRLRVGSRRGRNDYFDSRNLDGGVTQQAVPALPAFGETVHVRLQWRIGRRWFTHDQAFTAADFPAPALTLADGARLPGRDVTFQWSDNGHAVDAWRLDVGSRRAARNYHTTGNLEAGASEAPVTGLPVEYDATVHVRLRYRLLGRWRAVDYAFLAAEPTQGGAGFDVACFFCGDSGSTGGDAPPDP